MKFPIPTSTSPLISVILLHAFLVVAASPAWCDDARPGTLTFAWPEGARADVTYSVEGWRKNGASTTTLQRMQMYELEVRGAATRGGANLEIERIWPELTAPSKPATNLFGKKIGGGVGALQNLVDDLPEYVPILRVNGDGQLVSVGGLDEIEARLEKALTESEAGPVERRQMASLTSEDALHAMSHQTWAALVTLWKRSLPGGRLSDRGSVRCRRAGRVYACRGAWTRHV